MPAERLPPLRLVWQALANDPGRAFAGREQPGGRSVETRPVLLLLLLLRAGCGGREMARPGRVGTMSCRGIRGGPGWPLVSMAIWVGGQARLATEWRSTGARKGRTGGQVQVQARTSKGTPSPLEAEQ